MGIVRSVENRRGGKNLWPEEKSVSTTGRPVDFGKKLEENDPILFLR